MINIKNFDILERLNELSISIPDFITEINSRIWWHTFNLGRDIITPGEDKTYAKLEAIKLPKDLSGRSVIDVGAFEGFFSFECERRGAERVVACDYHAWNLAGRPAKDNFMLMHNIFNSKVEILEIPVEEITEEIGQFDLVLFLGVLYHSPNPLDYLIRMRKICKGVCIVETHLDALDSPLPAAIFYPGASFAGDPTNFWGPNRIAVEGMLREAGFNEVRILPDWAPGRTTSFGVERATSRAVFHAFV